MGVGWLNRALISSDDKVSIKMVTEAAVLVISRVYEGIGSVSSEPSEYITVDS